MRKTVLLWSACLVVVLAMGITAIGTTVATLRRVFERQYAQGTGTLACNRVRECIRAGDLAKAAS